MQVAPITFTGLFRWILVLFLAALIAVILATRTVRKDIVEAHDSLGNLVILAASQQKELWDENQSLLRQRDALKALILQEQRESRELRAEYEELVEFTLETDKRNGF